MKKLILVAFALTVMVWMPVKADHCDYRGYYRSCSPYPYAYFNPYRAQVVYSSQPVYPTVTYAAPVVVYGSPVVYYPACYRTPNDTPCRKGGLTIKIRF